MTIDKPVLIPKLNMHSISKAFGATVALEKVDFTVMPGEVHALVGENGAGKSTLVKILAGVYAPDKGKIQLDGHSFRPQNPLQARRSGIGMIYQELSLIPHLTVEENILLGIEPVKFGFIQRKKMRDKSREIIEIFDHPEIQPEVPVRKLSIAAQQLVEIGRSLVMGSSILVFDEPTSSLSQNDTDRLFELIARLKKQGLAIIYISHFLEEVNRIADRITVLRDGKIVKTQSVGDITEKDIVRLMVGREVQVLYPRTDRLPGDVVIEIQNLKGIHLPEDASITLKAGEILGIFGLIGAGRTEFIRAIFGLNLIQSGQISVKGISGFALPSERWRHGIGFMSENRTDEGLAMGMTIADNLTISNLSSLARMGFMSISAQGEAAQNWIDTLDIHCRNPMQSIYELSGGNQQKVALGRLLYHDVDVLLLDEPTRGIDVAAKAKIYEILNHLTSPPQRKAVLIVSSYLPELMGICDRIAVMYRGNLSEALPVDQVDQHVIMAKATGQIEDHLVATS